MNQIIVIGAGASGLIAAISAARAGAKVILLERLDRVGKKILATGNGRCNLSNRYTSVDKFHGKNNKFVLSPLKAFNVEDTIKFFEEIGIQIKEEEGKLYPFSDQASSILDVLRYEVKRLGIEEFCEKEVIKIDKTNHRFIVKTSDGHHYKGDKVILATGGNASPNLGSNGSGYKLAKGLGHCISQVFPALVQLKLEAGFLKAVKGVKFLGECTILSEGKEIRSEKGEILYTDYGISGPPILQLSRMVGESLIKKKRTEIKIDMINDRSWEELEQLLMNRFVTMSYKTVEESFIGLINKRLIIPLLKLAQVDKNKKCASLSKKDRRDLVKVLKDLRLTVTGSKSWGNAQVTAGGVLTNEINPSTMESKIVKGCFMTGELLDIDGDCGGYNLQWAWSTGFLAGLNAARSK